MVWAIFKIHPCLLPYSSWIWMFALEYRWVWWALIFLLVIWILLAVFRRFSRNILWTLCGFMSISRYLFALQIQSMLLVVTWKKKCSTKIVRSLNNHHLGIYSICACVYVPFCRNETAKFVCTCAYECDMWIERQQLWNVMFVVLSFILCALKSIVDIYGAATTFF